MPIPIGINHPPSISNTFYPEKSCSPMPGSIQITSILIHTYFTSRFEPIQLSNSTGIILFPRQIFLSFHPRTGSDLKCCLLYTSPGKSRPVAGFSHLSFPARGCTNLFGKANNEKSNRIPVRLSDKLSLYLRQTIKSKRYGKV